MQRIKRIVIATAITAVAAASIPAIAAADTSTGSGSGGMTQQAACAGIKAVHNVIGLAWSKMDSGSAAAAILGAASDATFDLGDQVCAS